MVKFEELFETYRERIIIIKNNEIVWNNSSALKILPADYKQRDIKEIVPEIILGHTADEFTVSAEICGIASEAIVRHYEGYIIVSVFPPESEEQAEMRNVLNSVSSTLCSALSLANMSMDLMKPYIEREKDEKLAMYAAMQSHSYYSMLHVIDNIACMNLPDDELTDDEKSYFDIATVCRDISDTVNVLISDENKKIKVCAEEHIPFFANKYMIRALIMKLLSNSIKHTCPGAVITISLHRNGKYLAISVRDFGKGIAGEELVNIFNKYKTEKKMDDGRPGAGFGLNAAKKIAIRHGGSVLLESKENVGTTVMAVLPIKGRKDLLVRDVEQPYAKNEMREYLTELSDVLGYKSYMAKFDD